MLDRFFSTLSKVAPLSLDDPRVVDVFKIPGCEVLTWPEVEKPAAGSLLPKRYCESADCVCRTWDGLFPLGCGSFTDSDGVLGRGVPGAVLAGVPAGL